MKALERIIVNHAITAQSAVDYMRCPLIIYYDDWSDVYKVVEFAKAKDEQPASSILDNQGGCGCGFFVCIIIATIIYFILCN